MFSLKTVGLLAPLAIRKTNTPSGLGIGLSQSANTSQCIQQSSMLARQVFQSGFSYSPHGYETLTSSIEHYLRIRSQDHIVACEHVFVVELLNLASGAHGDVNQMWFNDGTDQLG